MLPLLRAQPLRQVEEQLRPRPPPRRGRSPSPRRSHRGLPPAPRRRSGLAPGNPDRNRRRSSRAGLMVAICRAISGSRPSPAAASAACRGGRARRRPPRGCSRDRRPGRLRPPIRRETPVGTPGSGSGPRPSSRRARRRPTNPTSEMRNSGITASAQQAELHVSVVERAATHCERLHRPLRLLRDHAGRLSDINPPIGRSTSAITAPSRTRPRRRRCRPACLRPALCSRCKSRQQQVVAVVGDGSAHAAGHAEADAQHASHSRPCRPRDGAPPGPAAARPAPGRVAPSRRAPPGSRSGSGWSNDSQSR